MLMVSHANTNPGLTKTWDPGEPDKYYPTGKRNYARVVTTDDYQGAAAAQFAAKDLEGQEVLRPQRQPDLRPGCRQGVRGRGEEAGHRVVGNDRVGRQAAQLHRAVPADQGQGPDCVYLGGIYDNNGGQLVKDKVAVLGDNTEVKLIGPDGFTGYPDLLKAARGRRACTSPSRVSSTDQLRQQVAAPAQAARRLQGQVRRRPGDQLRALRRAALQVILAAIAKSDGTRKGVTRRRSSSGAGSRSRRTSRSLGKEIMIDPETGDVNAKDISVVLIKDNKETFLKAWPVELT